MSSQHTRVYPVEISSCLEKDFEVNGTVMSGARLQNITNLVDKHVTILGNNDKVIVWRGADDITKNEANIGLTFLGKAVNSKQNTNIMIVTATHRQDLQEISGVVNKETELLNGKLHRMRKTADNVMIIQTDISRNDFTSHGLQLNISGKGKMA